MPANTPQLSPVVEARSRKNNSMILQRLAMVGQNAVSEGLGLAESTISRFKEGEIDRMAKMLAILGLKVVPIEMKCYPSQQIDALFILAKERMREMESADQLSCESD